MCQLPVSIVILSLVTPELSDDKVWFWIHRQVIRDFTVKVG